MKTKKHSVSRSSQKLFVASKTQKLQKKSDYNQDFYQWTKKQAAFLKQGNLTDLDIANLVEEIESLGKSDKRSLKSHLIVLLQHLLKTEYQPSKRTNSWKRSIVNARLEINLILEDSPSLKNELPRILQSAYEYACTKAAMETGLDESVFPQKCPWIIQDVI